MFDTSKVGYKKIELDGQRDSEPKGQWDTGTFEQTYKTMYLSNNEKLLYERTR